MAKPLTCQQALESGVAGYYEIKASGVIEFWNARDVVLYADRKDSKFLPIPTPEELLSEVEVEVCYQPDLDHPDDSKAFLKVAEFQDGDRVRVRKVKG